MILAVFAERRSGEAVQLTADLATTLAAEIGQSVTRFGIRTELRGSAEGVVAQDLLSFTAGALTQRLRAIARARGSAVALVSGRTEQALASLDAADMILLVSDLTVPSLRRLQRSARFCESLGIARSRSGIVLLTTGDEPVTPAEARAVLKRDPIAIIPALDGRAAAIRVLVSRLLAS